MRDLLLYSIAYLTLIYAGILLFKKNRHSTDILLAVWLIFIAASYGMKHYVWEFCIGYTHCVFLFLYTKCLITNKFEKKDILHFIPFVIISLTCIFYTPNYFLYKAFFTIYFWIVYICIYFGATIKLIIDYRNQMQNKPVSKDSPNILWLWLNVIITITSHLLSIIPTVITIITHQGVDRTPYRLIVLILLNIIGIKALRLNLIFVNQVRPVSNSRTNSDKTKLYSTYNLKDEELLLLEQKLRDLMETKKVYLKPDLSLKDLAENLDVLPHHLSYLLNIKFNQNFYEFINNYRLEAVKNELINPNNKHLSIFAIACDCGFNSQSTFNRIFKQKMGVSPSKYREQYIITT